MFGVGLVRNSLLINKAAMLNSKLSDVKFPVSETTVSREHGNPTVSSVSGGASGSTANVLF